MNEKAVLSMLMQNMGYNSGETIAILTQEWDPSFNEGGKPRFDETNEVAYLLRDVYQAKGFPVKFISYVPTKASSAVEPPEEVFEELKESNVIFMPVAHSLSWTNFRVELSRTGARIASMPGFTVEMFEENGPMDANFSIMQEYTEQTLTELKNAKYVKVTGKDTAMIVQLEPGKAFGSSADLSEAFAFGNLPGAESYALPLMGGESNGYFTVPAGWGGNEPLKYKATFFVEKGRFVDVKGEDEQAQEWIDKHVKPFIFGQENFDVLAELGIGTNPNITNTYIETHQWSTLTAEKVFGSAHFANGNNVGMGGTNEVNIHQDWVVPDVKIEFIEEGVYEGASIILLTPDGKVIMQERGNHSKYGEEWAVFGGGREPEDENLLQTAKREAKEELDLDVDEVILITEFFKKERHGPNGERMGAGRIAAYLCKKRYEVEELTVLEGAGAKAFTIDEALNLKIFDDNVYTLEGLKKFLEQ